jgi:hypothetical protein
MKDIRNILEDIKWFPTRSSMVGSGFGIRARYMSNEENRISKGKV